MKALKRIAAALTLMTSMSAAADCQITLSMCKPMGIRAYTHFMDAYKGSDKDPNRCLARARDYFNYCNSNQEVGADFYVGSVLTVGNYVTGTTSQLWTKTATGLWVRLPGTGY